MHNPAKIVRSFSFCIPLAYHHRLTKYSNLHFILLQQSASVTAWAVGQSLEKLVVSSVIGSDIQCMTTLRQLQSTVEIEHVEFIVSKHVCASS
jgi:hypothetical protein